MNFRSTFIGVAVGFTATATLGAEASANAEAFMKTGGRAPQPIGHYHFCKVHPAECVTTSTPQRTARLSELAWRVIEEVNSKVNGKIIQVTDEDYYGKVEFWTYPKTSGDCEDIALLKKRELKARGFQESDLLMTVVRKSDGSGHAVLTVRTSEGDFVLDNLDDRVRRWRKTPYRFEKRQSSDDAGRWVVVEQRSGDTPVAAIDN